MVIDEIAGLIRAVKKGTDMRLVETRIERGQRERRSTEKTSGQGNGMGHTTGSAEGILGDEEGRHRVSEGNRIPVTFWAAEGSCHEGTIPKVNREILFLETAQLFPVGTEISFRLQMPMEGDASWDVATGTVIWVCPEEDHFMNRKGFGLSTQSLWPQPNDASETRGFKGAR